MFIFTMSCARDAVLGPRRARRRSRRRRSSSTEGRSVSENRRATLPGLAGRHHRRGRGLAAHPHQRDPLGAAPHRLGVGERVGRVGVAGPGRGQHVRAGPGDARAPPSTSSRRPPGRRPARRRSGRARGRRSSRAETKPAVLARRRAARGRWHGRARCRWRRRRPRPRCGSRPKRCSSISVSQSRKRGQARVHRVQPLAPWVQSSGPPSASTWKGL